MRRSKPKFGATSDVPTDRPRYQQMNSKVLSPPPGTTVYLLTAPPRAPTRDHHRTIQIQKVIPGENNTSRIRPILNLETHRLFAPRVIEMETDDVKICEFQPSKPRSTKTNTGRARTLSIDEKSGSFGGKVTSTKDSNGIYDMTVIGSEGEGLFLFQLRDNSSLTWRRTGTTWFLDDLHAASVLPATSQRHEEVVVGDGERLPLPRRQTGDSLYTIHFENESQLSNIGGSIDIAVQTNGPVPQGSLTALPIPHLQLLNEPGKPYPMLISALWIAHCSRDITFDDYEDPQLRVPSRMPIEEPEDTLATPRRNNSIVKRKPSLLARVFSICR